jgi:hypothetical protein
MAGISLLLARRSGSFPAHGKFEFALRCFLALFDEANESDQFLLMEAEDYCGSSTARWRRAF